MARIKIEDLPRDTKLDRQAMKHVLGGMVSGIENNIVDPIPTRAGLADLLAKDHPGPGGMFASAPGVWDDTDIVH